MYDLSNKAWKVSFALLMLLGSVAYTGGNSDDEDETQARPAAQVGPVAGEADALQSKFNNNLEYLGLPEMGNVLLMQGLNAVALRDLHLSNQLDEAKKMIEIRLPLGNWIIIRTALELIKVEEEIKMDPEDVKNLKEFMRQLHLSEYLFHTLRQGVTVKTLADMMEAEFREYLDSIQIGKGHAIRFDALRQKAQNFINPPADPEKVRREEEAFEKLLHDFGISQFVKGMKKQGITQSVLATMTDEEFEKLCKSLMMRRGHKISLQKLRVTCQ